MKSTASAHAEMPPVLKRVLPGVFGQPDVAHVPAFRTNSIRSWSAGLYRNRRLFSSTHQLPAARRSRPDPGECLHLVEQAPRNRRRTRSAFGHRLRAYGQDVIHRVDDVGVELRPGMSPQFLERRGGAHRQPVRPVADHRVEAIRDRDDARG